MPITYPGKIAGAEATTVRDDVTTTDNATINDTNFPPADATDCAGWKSVILLPTFVGGTNPTVTVQVLMRFGALWRVVATTSALSASDLATVTAHGRKVYFRVHAITGSPTSLDLLCSGYEPFRFDGPARG